jgi:dTDP-glucose pyrophosphorylase
MHTTLLVMAAGLGSRFGGNKQIAKVGPHGELLLHYSIYDAAAAGFDKVVFVIKRAMEAEFRALLEDSIPAGVEVHYAFQEFENLPGGFVPPAERVKPYGTVHAVLAAKDVINEPFAVLNADDYYGKDAYVKLHDYIVNNMNTENHDVLDIAMPGFILGNTLSDNGSVTRGVCTVDTEGNLASIVETSNIYKDGKGGAYVEEKDGSHRSIDVDSLVSMNMWAFTPAFIDRLESGFIDFLAAGNATQMKAEYLLPTVIGGMLEEGSATVKVLKTTDKWFGVTYKEDKDYVIESFKKLIADGVYSEKLFG